MNMCGFGVIPLVSPEVNTLNFLIFGGNEEVQSYLLQTDPCMVTKKVGNKVTKKESMYESGEYWNNHFPIPSKRLTNKYFEDQF